MASNSGLVRKKFNKVVLAYSGGLDTSVIVPWLRLGVSLFSSLLLLINTSYYGYGYGRKLLSVFYAGRTMGVRLSASLQMLAKYV